MTSETPEKQDACGGAETRKEDDESDGSMVREVAHEEKAGSGCSCQKERRGRGKMETVSLDGRSSR
jgi:hypothetical protein